MNTTWTAAKLQRGRVIRIDLKYISKEGMMRKWTYVEVAPKTSTNSPSFMNHSALENIALKTPTRANRCSMSFTI